MCGERKNCVLFSYLFQFELSSRNGTGERDWGRGMESPAVLCYCYVLALGSHIVGVVVEFLLFLEH